ncbi:MAG: WD40/YVTN/BNR-like repeat-containing protein, partial [Gemmatimonadaceae bacterium]
MRPIRHAFWAALFACADQLDAQVVRTWTDINPSQSALAANGGSGGRVNGLGRSATGSAFYAASEMGGLYKSADGGLTWTHLSGHVPMVTWDVDVDPSNANRVYATSWYDGKVASRAGISVSIDGGVTWTKPATATPAAGVCEGDDRRDNPSAFGIAIDPANTNRVFIGTNCGLARSLDAGATWTFIDPDPGVLANDVWDVAIHHGNVVDACGDDGHARSTDGGVNWTTSANLPTGRCSIAVSPDEANVVFVVFGSSIYQTADGGVTW